MSKKPNGYWKNTENMKKELKKAIKMNNGEFPSQKDLVNFGFCSMGAAAIKYHGGLGEIRTMMGYKLIRRPNGYWKNTENMKKELKKAIKMNNGEFPSHNELRRIGFGPLSVAINRHYDGIRNIREQIGYKNKIKPDRYWENWKNVETELKEAIKMNNGEFPNQKDLVHMGFGSIIHSISKYHGGMSNVRKKMGYQIIKRPDRYWENWKNVETELKEAIKMNNGEFPTSTGLKQIGFSSLYFAIKGYGGIYAVREKIGYNEKMSRQLAKELEEIVRDYE